MKTKHQSEIPIVPVDMEGAEKVGKQVLMSAADGTPNFAMRRFTVQPGGNTPLHTHDSEHEVFVLAGQGKLVFEGDDYTLRPGSFAYVDPGHEHQFINTGSEDFVFLCVVPNQK